MCWKCPLRCVFVGICPQELDMERIQKFWSSSCGRQLFGHTCFRPALVCSVGGRLVRVTHPAVRTVERFIDLDVVGRGGAVYFFAVVACTGGLHLPLSSHIGVLGSASLAVSACSSVLLVPRSRNAVREVGAFALQDVRFQVHTDGTDASSCGVGAIREAQKQ